MMVVILLNRRGATGMPASLKLLLQLVFPRVGVATEKILDRVPNGS